MDVQSMKYYLHPYPCRRSYIQVNVNKIICRETQGSNQKELLSGQDVICAIFLEIFVWWRASVVQDGHRGLAPGFLALLSHSDYCPNLIWRALCHIAVLLWGKIWNKALHRAAGIAFSRYQHQQEGTELSTWQRCSVPGQRKTTLPSSSSYKFTDLRSSKVYIPF